MDITKGAYLKAIEVLEKCETPYGFFAAYPGYDAVWARDSMITSIGASFHGKKFKNTFKNSIVTLAKHQSPKGQIPNAIDKYSKRSPHVDYLSIDSTLWFLIGQYFYRKKFKDSTLFRIYKKNIEKALTWLSYQDFGENSMLVQLPTTDWQDAFPHRYGYTINTQALYFKVLKIFGENYQSLKLKNSVNKIDTGLWQGNYYLPWRWKSHNKYKEKGEWFDSLGNLLAIVFDLSDKKKTKKILNHIENKKIAKPFPIKSIYPPIRKDSKDWRDYFLDSDARTPYHYSNAGIWPYIGGFYVLALIKEKKFIKAKKQLEKLATANMKLNGNFSEWLDGRTGKPSKGGFQAWNAGMYILAYKSMKNKTSLI